MNIFNFTVGMLFISQVALAWITKDPEVLRHFSMGAFSVALLLVGHVIKDDNNHYNDDDLV